MTTGLGTMPRWAKRRLTYRNANATPPANAPSVNDATSRVANTRSYPSALNHGHSARSPMTGEMKKKTRMVTPRSQRARVRRRRRRGRRSSAMGRKLLALRPNCCHHAVNRSPASETAGERRESPLLLRGHRCGRLNQLEIELSFAFDKEQTLRGRIAARRVPVVAARLQEIRSGAEPEFRLALRSLDESPGHDHDLHVVRVGVEGRSESGRELEERPECALRVIAPQIRNLDSGGAGRVEIRPLQVAGRHNDEPACRCFCGALAFRLSKQYRRRRERDQQRQEVSHSHRVPLVSGTRSSRLADGPEPIAPCRSSPLRPAFAPLSAVVYVQRRCPTRRMYPDSVRGRVALLDDRERGRSADRQTRRSKHVAQAVPEESGSPRLPHAGGGTG